MADASRIRGVARYIIYRHRKLIKHGGIEPLKRQETPALRHKNHTDRSFEELVNEFSLANPHVGQSKMSWLVKSHRNVDIHASGVLSTSPKLRQT